MPPSNPRRYATLGCVIDSRNTSGYVGESLGSESRGCVRGKETQHGYRDEKERGRDIEQAQMSETVVPYRFVLACSATSERGDVPKCVASVVAFALQSATASHRCPFLPSPVEQNTRCRSTVGPATAVSRAGQCRYMSGSRSCWGCLPFLCHNFLLRKHSQSSGPLQVFA